MLRKCFYKLMDGERSLYETEEEHVLGLIWTTNRVFMLNDIVLNRGYSYQNVCRSLDRILFKSSCFIEESILLIACNTIFEGMGGREIFFYK